MKGCLTVFYCVAVCVPYAQGADVDEFRIKRQEVFEFAAKPTVTRAGDKTTINFASKGYCDVTVAIENAAGRIIRHLASGVLGPNAPLPFQRDSKQQTIEWDGKDDQEAYVDNKEALTVRVSLGLKPQFEKSLYWSPYKRISQAAPLLAANAEGVLVCEGSGVDSIRLYDHAGTYVRTVYPFPAAKLSAVKGLDWYDFPEGVRYPLKKSLYQQTLLTSGENCSVDDVLGRSGRGASCLAVLGKRLVLAGLRLNRLTTDGDSGGAELAGGATLQTLNNIVIGYSHNNTIIVSPTSAAISPDSKWVYVSGYTYRYMYNFDTMHGVARLPLDGAADAAVFAGKLESKEGFASGWGSGPGEFKNATSVACDTQGRVYVSDFMNDRIQIFSPDGRYLKEIKVFKPAVVRVSPLNGEIWVFTWMAPSRLWSAAEPPIEVTPALTRFAPFDNPKEISHCEIPLGRVKVKANGKYGTYTGLPHPHWFTGEVDFWTDPPTLWIGRECRNDIESGVHPGDGGQTTPWESAGTKLVREKDGKLEIIRDFGAETIKEVVRAKPPANAIQRLEVSPLTGKLYVGEADSGPTIKAHNQLLEIDPESGAMRLLDLPFNPMEYVFDLNGYLYLRNTDMIARYELPGLTGGDARATTGFREIPFDYGEARPHLGNDGGIMGKQTTVVSGLVLPSKSPVCYHQGGIHVSARGHIIASCAYRFVGISGKHYALDKEALAAQGGLAYQPKLYPGRISNSTAPCLHIWDSHGKLIREDVVPGIGQVDGVALDRDDNVYTMHTATRVLDGKKYFNEMSETLMKIKPANAKIVCASPGAPLPLNAADKPRRAPELNNGPLGAAWAEGVQWFFGGVGYAGFNSAHAGGGCACWFSRFALDYFARSIVPEPQLFGVAVLDSNGNLILRIGKYGNVDDGVPLVPGKVETPPRGVPTAHSVGGDEVALFHACFVGTHTDRRIFISDVGNGRILSVKLGYHAEEKVALKDVPDNKGK